MSDRGTRRTPHYCEPLEPRRLLTGDPVVVFTEPVSLNTITNGDVPVTSATVRPRLWDASDEFDWEIEDHAQVPGPWMYLGDEDGNGYAGDAYGWNFFSGSPNIIDNSNGHGAYIMQAALSAL